MEYSDVDPSGKYERPDIPKELGVFERSDLAYDYENMPENKNLKRDLDLYYSRRAYHGAPPFIPHAVKSERSMGANTCLQCHENGGFVEQFDAYAPVAPHPDKINCRQCHVEQKENTLFKQTNWKKRKQEKFYVNALPGSPPVIPHQIQMRENCLSCHAGPSAPKAIKVSHPERVNCRQCHAANNQEVTKIKELTSFYREVR
jgi:cytochrome c-type protein NapB